MRATRALQAALWADLCRQHRELRTQVLHTYGIHQYHRNELWIRQRWGW